MDGPLSLGGPLGAAGDVSPAAPSEGRISLSSAIDTAGERQGLVDGTA